MRAFIAVDLAPEIKSAVEGLVRALRRKGGNVAWVKPEAMHLTLKFLGNISDEEAGAITALLERIAAGRRPFPLKLKGTGTFPPGGRANARILWAGIAETPELMEIQSALESECEKAGFPGGKTFPSPHPGARQVRRRAGRSSENSNETGRSTGR
jgi:2'-5' RNA ligase